VTLVAVVVPNIRGSPPAIDVVTDKTAYIKDYLPLYAGRFSTVGLDFSYYALPQAENLAKLLK
jgi:uncharacterized protein YecE (DUF72 family)